MNVVYDLVFFAKERFGGISRYWMEMFKRLPGSAIDPTFLVGPADNIVQDFLLQNHWFGGHACIEEASGLFAKLRQLGFYRALQILPLNAHGSRVFHSTDYINPLVARPGLKIVTTIHDMVFWDQEDRFDRNVWFWDKRWSTWHALHVSDRVIAVSHASRDAIVRRFPWAADRIVVIHHGLDDSLRNVTLRPSKDRSFLFVGGRNCYKNYELLVDAFADFAHDYPDWTLNVVGDGESTRAAELARYRALGIEDRVQDHGLVAQEKLVDMLSRAGAVVIPSLSEGFNFPLIEAMAAGAPVLSSSIPASLEIGGSHPRYFDPRSKAELLAAMRATADSPAAPEALSAAQAHARSFEWQASFDKMCKVYETCLGEAA